MWEMCMYMGRPKGGIKEKRKGMEKGRRHMRILMHLCKVMYMCHYMCKLKNQKWRKKLKMKLFLEELPVMQSLVHISLTRLLSSDFDRGERRSDF